MEVMLDVKEDKLERIAMVCKFIEEMKLHEPLISEEEDSKRAKELILQWDYPTLMDKPGNKNPPASFQQLNKDLADFLVDYAKKKFANNKQLPNLTKSMKETIIIPKRFFKKIDKDAKKGTDKIRISASKDKMYDKDVVSK